MSVADDPDTTFAADASDCSDTNGGLDDEEGAEGDDSETQALLLGEKETLTTIAHRYDAETSVKTENDRRAAYLLEVYKKNMTAENYRAYEAARAIAFREWQAVEEAAYRRYHKALAVIRPDLAFDLARGEGPK